MGMTSTLTRAEREAIKQMLWEGTPNKEVSTKFGVSTQYMTNVRAGKLLADIPWPDGSKGGMPDIRKEQLTKGRRFDTHVAKAQGVSSTERRGWAELGAGDTYDRLLTAAREAGFTTVEEFHNWVNRDKDEAHRRRLQAELDTIVARGVTNPFYDPDAPKRPRHEDVPIDPDATDKLSWDDVLKVGRDIPLVAALEEAPDLDMQAAVQIVFFGIRGADARRGEQAKLAIREVYRKILMHRAAQPPALVALPHNMGEVA